MVFPNTYEKIIKLLKAMNEAGVKPELECFDTGHTHGVWPLLDMGVLKPPLQFSFIVNVLGGIPAHVESLQLQPARGIEPELMKDPTVYRFFEALSVYGPALKELIHEEFGDGIMSAINFKVDIRRRAHPDGDRVVVTFDGKFLDYRW